MPGRPQKPSGYIVSRTIDQRKELAAALLEKLKPELIDAIAHGKLNTCRRLTDKINRHAKQFSDDAMRDFDAPFSNWFKTQFEEDGRKVRNIFRQLISEGKSESEALRTIRRDFYRTTIFFCMPSFGMAEIRLDEIVHMRFYSEEALQILATYSGREPETIRKLIRPVAKEGQAWRDFLKTLPRSRRSKQTRRLPSKRRQ